MPLVKIYVRRNITEPALHTISDAVHEALVAEANVPPDDRFHILHRLEGNQIVAHPSYGGVSRSDEIVVIEITLNAGRTVEVKKNLYADIAKRLEALGIRPDDVVVSLIEVTKENWSFGGGRATYA
ncbi:MAG TPA: tautomerase family protein [Thermoanaerobaculia bacterium]|jgi:phenylpyruvate tautomerase PptA (4-oxalocrotonate tautomerase family)|nr:tautomerase family protein [Thermoanaerobaculia bacterium]